MQRLREAIRLKRSELRKNKSFSKILHHDNAPAHTSMLVRYFLAQTNTAIRPYSLYSQDLEPCDVFLYPKQKRPMKGKRFATIDEIKSESKSELMLNPKSAFQKCLGD
ncbi:hypothetical protein WA026_000784 [Henosepilachna vigintioctopunctata]|uniref:Transposase n=1 Tax=Henosepilachna vigintioctopunctata TaxID=420089 RepID=A0AAW1V581_9CUCU